MTAHGLLDIIAANMQLSYLSDLQNASRDKLYTLIIEMDKAPYSLEEWNDALSYILNEAVALNSVEEISNFLSCSEQG